ncbi:MAG: ABC transporter ATP-binding protein [Lachnospiraceae bacterium]|nr:ABC transporter ATP-binding protein [Lachnospiraceae bacterium]
MLHIENLSKYYGTFRALNNVNLHINKGELFGFVGSNGAGKTTTMKICVGLLRADSGRIVIDGYEVRKNTKLLKQKVGYVPDFFGAYDNLTSIEYLNFFANAYGIYGKEADKLSEDLLALVNLSDKRNHEVDGLSRGMKQRLCLARALVHNPDLLFLDEPASGLDPKARYELKEILKSLSSMGKTIVISSHILPELAEMCSSFGIIDRGVMKMTGTLRDIQQAANFSSMPIVIVVRGDSEPAVQALRELPATKYVRPMAEGRIEVDYLGGIDDEVELLKILVNKGIPVVSYGRMEGTLENVFLQLMNGGQPQNGPAPGPVQAAPPMQAPMQAAPQPAPMQPAPMQAPMQAVPQAPAGQEVAR